MNKENRELLDSVDDLSFLALGEEEDEVLDWRDTVMVDLQQGLAKYDGKTLSGLVRLIRNKVGNSIMLHETETCLLTNTCHLHVVMKDAVCFYGASEASVVFGGLTEISEHERLAGRPWSRVFDGYI